MRAVVQETLRVGSVMDGSFVARGRDPRFVACEPIQPDAAETVILGLHPRP